LLTMGIPVEVRNQDGQTPLHPAARHRRPDMLVFLIARGAGVDVVDRSGCTPLMVASMAGRSNNCSRLLEAGARLNAVNNAGFGPLYCAILAGQFETAAVLIRAGGRLGEPPTDEVDSRFCYALYQKLFADYLFETSQLKQASLDYKAAEDALRKVRNDYAEEWPRALQKAEVRKFWSNLGQQAFARLGEGMVEGVIRAGQAYEDRAAFRGLAEAAALRDMKSPSDYFALRSVYMTAYKPSTPSNHRGDSGNYTPLRPMSADLIVDARVSFLKQSVEVCDAFLADIETRSKGAQ